MKTTVYIFVLFFIDDIGRRHLTIARNRKELQYIQDRFERVEYTVYQKDI